MATPSSKTISFKNLLPLTLGGFSIGMTEFLIMGVLPNVSQSLNISIPTAGYLIAIYALGVVIGAPLMIAVSQRFTPKHTLIGLMLLFAIFNLLFSVAPSFPLLLFSRFMSGLPHGAFFGVGAVVATRLAKPGKGASTVALMFAGLTLANIVGVPIGTYIGNHYSWRIAYFIVALSGFMTLASLIKWLPDVEINQTNNFIKSMKILKHLDIWLIIGISSIGMGGLFAWISYIAPLMINVALFSANMVTFIMMTAGTGMALGIMIGGKLADKFSPLFVTALLLSVMMICLLIIANTVHNQFMALLMTFITGAVAFAVIPPMQMLMIQAAEGSEMLASSLVQASSNMGNSLGAFLGGLPIAAGFGYTSPEYVGFFLAMTGVVFCFGIQRLTRESTHLKNTADSSS
jgi:MFS transporter, DHA1 family, arabinose polymer utilization protein